MKKKYQNLRLDVIKIYTTGMLALSKGTKPVTNENEVLSRDYDFDDEEE